MKFPAIITLLMLLAILQSCNTSDEKEYVDSLINPGSVTITGKINNYDGSIKTGSILYFDVITRIGNREIFPVDSTGNYIVSFELLLPSGTNIFRLGNNRMSLYAHPGDTFEINLKQPGEFEIPDGPNSLNDQFMDLKYNLYAKFLEEDQHRNKIQYPYSDSLNYPELCSFLGEIASKKKQFVEDYCDSNNISNEIRELFIAEVEYEPAWARICCNLILRPDGYVENRKNLPSTFYEDLLKEFPIDNPSASGARKFMDYISNLQQSFVHKSRVDDKKVTDFFKKNSNFSDEEILLISRSWIRDTSIINSEEYKTFQKTNRNIGRLSRLYYIDFTLNSLESFTTGYGRDIVISQTIGSHSFDGEFLPLNDETWKRIESMITHKVIYDQLYLIDRRLRAKLEQPIGSSSELLETILAKNSNEFFSGLFDQFTGKYVYVDFWATWCGPCKSEMPFSKVLHDQYKDENIVFLYLCCSSDKDSWQQYIKSEQLPGIHYFINPDEQNYLSQFFKIEGYPTYAIVDPKGKVISEPPRPSSIRIEEYITDLLKSQ